MANHSPNSITVPDGFTLHTENTSHILLPSNNEAFLNPVQEFNRDLSVAAIRVWSEEMNGTKEERWRQARERRLMRTAKRPIPDRKRPKVDQSAEQATSVLCAYLTSSALHGHQYPSTTSRARKN
jgi:tRNA (guanine26-N2/guanine27-N2)-dimethyltransferase